MVKSSMRASTLGITPAPGSRRRSVNPSDYDPRRRSIAPSEGMGEDEDDFQPVEVKRKPANQVQLTEEQLGETFTRSIDGGNPNSGKNQVYFDYDKMEYNPQAVSEQLAVHFNMESDLIWVETEEARAQAARTARRENPDQLGVKPLKTASFETSSKVRHEDEEEPVEGAEVEAETIEPQPGVKQELVKNQFNFSGRATQTFNNSKRSKLIVTEPPPTAEVVGQVSTDVIFDHYLDDIERKVMAAIAQENSKKKKKKQGDADEDTLVDDNEGEGEPLADPNLARALKIMERLVHTGSEVDVFNYYKFYEDKNEAKREDGRGAFWPLWTFSHEPAHRASVTCMCWNPEYTDLFAVGHGSYEFTKQGGNGMVCCYTLKNTSYPEYVFETESGVMTLDFNSEHSCLLCVGMYDGSVAVYDMRNKNLKPIFQSHSPETKHTDPVWQVYWGKTDAVKGLNFYSISSDGKVNNWMLAKTSLAKEELLVLKLDLEDTSSAPAGEEDGEDAYDSAILGLAGGSCFDFNPQDNDLFVVGTEEGALQSYSKKYSAEFVRAFEGHHMATYSVKWNRFHPNVFLSCSADWTVKLWQATKSSPIMTFDLNTAVGDVAWSPFSATVFAAITTDGRVRVYDLAVNKHEAIGEYRGDKKRKLTKVCFNPVEPILVVGDDKGTSLTLKLSANLRKMTAASIEEINVETEIARLDKVMVMPAEETGDDIASLLEAANKGDTSIGNPNEPKPAAAAAAPAAAAAAEPAK